MRTVVSHITTSLKYKGKPAKLQLLHRSSQYLESGMRILHGRVCKDSATTFACSSSLALQWRHNGLESVPNHQPHHCLFSRLFGGRSQKTSKLRVTGLCAGNSPGTGEFPAQMASNAENVSIWWRHHGSITYGFRYVYANIILYT